MDNQFAPLPTMDGVPMGATIEQGIPGYMDAHGVRKNHLFCGCCCDTRRATLVVNIISISSSFLFIILMFLDIKLVEQNDVDAMLHDPNNPAAANLSEDQIQQFEEMTQNGSLEILETMVDIFLFLSIILHSFGVYGAIKFKVWAVTISAVAFGFSALFALLSGDLGSVFVSGLFMYPHIVFIQEMNAGIMTDYNYEHVKNCCGGV